MKVKRTIVLLTSLAVLTALAAFAPPAHARQSLRKVRTQACQDKSSGDPCTYTHKGEDVNGTCQSGRHNKLICTATSGGAMNAPAGATEGENPGATGGPEGGTMGGGTGAMGSPSTGTAGAPAGGAGGTGGTAP